MPTPKLKFILDEEYSVETALQMITERVKCNRVYGNVRLEYSELTAIETLIKSGESNLEKEKNRIEARKIIKKNYQDKGIQILLRESLSTYQKSWDEINKDFFETIVRLTGFPWTYDEYECVLSPFVVGVSSWNGNKIVRSCGENSLTMRKITAHELILAHIFDILTRVFGAYDLTSRQKWAISEICASMVTGSDEVENKFWPWSKVENCFKSIDCHKELYVLRDILKKDYTEQLNFKKFLIMAIAKTQDFIKE